MACTLVVNCFVFQHGTGQTFADWTCSANLSNTSVEDSMFFTAAVMSCCWWPARLRRNRPGAATPAKENDIADARLICEPLVARAVDVVHRAIACSETVRRLCRVAEKLVSVCSFSTTRRIRDRFIQVFWRFRQCAGEPEAERATSCKIKRLLAVGLGRRSPAPAAHWKRG